MLVCEHASNYIPASLDGLGLSGPALSSHAAWDIGALEVATALSEKLGAPLVSCTVSRLVYDCNRPLEAYDSIPSRSEIYDIPGNLHLADKARQERFEKVHQPFHAAVSDVIATQGKKAQKPVTIVTIHSFTPVYNGKTRTVQLGFLHDACAHVADTMLAHEQENAQFQCAINEPYKPADGVAYTLRKHGDMAGLDNVMIEIRNDLINTPETAATMAAHLAATLSSSIQALSHDEVG